MEKRFIGASVLAVAVVATYVLLRGYEIEPRVVQETRNLTFENRQQLAATTKRLDNLTSQFDRLTGDELQRRIRDLSSRLTMLEKQLASLQQIISPSSASEILTVARMRDEILARQKFEDRVSKIVEPLSAKLDTMQQALIGMLLGVIASLVGIIWALVKKTSRLYHLVQAVKPEHKPARNSDPEEP